MWQLAGAVAAHRAVAQELILSLGSAGRALSSKINEFHLAASKSDCTVPCCYLFMFSTKKFM